MNQQPIIVTEIAEGICYYPELADWVRELDQDPDDPHFEPLSLMEGHPDIIRCNQDETYFIDIQRGYTTYILTSNEVSQPIKEMLEKFYQDSFPSHYRSVTNTWEEFRKHDNAIAYRGGKGYSYTIWQYKNPINFTNN